MKAWLQPDHVVVASHIEGLTEVKPDLRSSAFEEYLVAAYLVDTTAEPEGSHQ